MMYEDGVPDDEIDIIVNSQLSGPQIYVKDNGPIFVKRSLAQAEKEYQQGCARTPQQSSQTCLDNKPSKKESSKL